MQGGSQIILCDAPDHAGSHFAAPLYKGHDGNFVLDLEAAACPTLAGAYPRFVRLDDPAGLWTRILSFEGDGQVIFHHGDYESFKNWKMSRGEDLDASKGPHRKFSRG